VRRCRSVHAVDGGDHTGGERVDCWSRRAGRRPTSCACAAAAISPRGCERRAADAQADGAPWVCRDGQRRRPAPSTMDAGAVHDDCTVPSARVVALTPISSPRRSTAGPARPGARIGWPASVTVMSPGLGRAVDLGHAVADRGEHRSMLTSDHVLSDGVGEPGLAEQSLPGGRLGGTRVAEGGEEPLSALPSPLSRWGEQRIDLLQDARLGLGEVQLLLSARWVSMSALRSRTTCALAVPKIAGQSTDALHQIDATARVTRRGRVGRCAHRRWASCRRHRAPPVQGVGRVLTRSGRPSITGRVPR